MIRSYECAVKFLASYIPDPNKKFPAQFGLDRMRYLCELLDNPQLKYKTIHVGGTAGKGSTSTIIATILAQKYKVSLHTSPHLVKVNERMKMIQECSTDISDNELVELVNEVKPVLSMMEHSKWGRPSYFEITTALAFLYFAKEKVDFAVIEVGMGGRFDGTNVVQPDVAILTNVGLDHTEILGDTVEKIAADKVGIIKPGIEVVSGVKQPSVKQILSSKIKNQKSKLSLLGKDFSYDIKKMSEMGSVFDYRGEKEYKDFHLSLLGAHQIENASLAIRSIEVLQNHSSIMNPPAGEAGHQSPISEHDIRKALKKVFIPGRLEIIHRDPLVILDGAHNPDKIEALTTAIKTIFSDKKIHAIVAIKKDKNAQKMILQLLRICSSITFTQYKATTDLGLIDSYDPHDLLMLSKNIKTEIEINIESDPMKSLSNAKDNIGSNGLILVTGSLYLVGEMKKYESLK